MLNNGLSNFTADTMASMHKALGGGSQYTMQKAGVTIATGLVYYDLQAPAKNLYPVITPLRNTVPRIQRANSGDATHWKQVSQIVGSGYNNMGWVPEGQRSAAMSYVTANKAATYVTLGEEDFLTFEAEAAAVGFEDENAMVTFRLLQKMMLKEEIGILCGNASLALGTASTPTTAAGGSGGTLPTATYVVIVVALTMEGYGNSSVSGGVATSKNITGMDGKTYTLYGGSSIQSAGASQAITEGEILSAYTAPKTGAVAYAWFVGTSGAERLQKITTTNSVTFSAPLASTTQLASSLSGDNSRNENLAFDGLFTQAVNPANLGYVKTMATGTPGTGTPLTASGTGTIVEVDDMLESMWNNYNISPTVMYVNSQELKNMTKKVLTNNSGPLLRYDMPGGQAMEYKLGAGGVIEFYYNPYTGSKMPIKIHPNLPPGTMVAWCETLPQWYQSNEVPNVAEIITRRDYYRIDWPLVTRQRQYGVYAEEVLAVYATFGMGVITNIANG